MTTVRGLLVIADISGYTEYMRTHRMSLAHAQVNTSRLLERVIDAVPALELIEIEGDAAFLYRRADSQDADDLVDEVVRAAVAMHQAFHAEREYVAKNLCPCAGCKEAGNLKLKFVAHVGEVATQTIRQRLKLVGIDVILVHRLLKNSVPLPEYVLMTNDLLQTGSGTPAQMQEITSELEGIGHVRSFYVDVAGLEGAEAPLPPPTWRGRLERTAYAAGAGLPHMLGRRRRRALATIGT